MLLKVTGSKVTKVLYMADQWRPATQWDSRYLWMPLQIKGDSLWLPEPRPFAIDVRSGETRLVSNQ